MKCLALDMLNIDELLLNVLHKKMVCDIQVSCLYPDDSPIVPKRKPQVVLCCYSSLPDYKGYNHGDNTRHQHRQHKEIVSGLIITNE